MTKPKELKPGDRVREKAITNHDAHVMTVLEPYRGEWVWLSCDCTEGRFLYAVENLELV